MNNFNALSQYIGSVNQAVNSLAKNNIDILNRLKNVENASNGSIDQERLEAGLREKFLRIIDDSVSKAVSAARAEVLAEVSGALAKLSDDFEKKLGEATKTIEALQAKQEARPLQEIDEIVIPELAPEVATLAEGADADDDIIIGMKKEAPKRRGARTRNL